jgi:hypothetical protein
MRSGNHRGRAIWTMKPRAFRFGSSREGPGSPCNNPNHSTNRIEEHTSGDTSTRHWLVKHWRQGNQTRTAALGHALVLGGCSLREDTTHDNVGTSRDQTETQRRRSGRRPWAARAVEAVEQSGSGALQREERYREQAARDRALEG